MTLVSTHETRPNNWGTHAGAARAAVARYLDDTAQLARTAAGVPRLARRSRLRTPASSSATLSWQCNPAQPVGINPKGCSRAGHRRSTAPCPTTCAGAASSMAADLHELRLGGDAGRDPPGAHPRPGGLQRLRLERPGDPAGGQLPVRPGDLAPERRRPLAAVGPQPRLRDDLVGGLAAFRPARTWASPTGCTRARPGDGTTAAAAIRGASGSTGSASIHLRSRRSTVRRDRRRWRGSGRSCDHRWRRSRRAIPTVQPPGDPPVNRFEPNLRIPGPTALPPSVREAGARQMINHRGPEFAAMLDRILTRMKPYFGTTNDVAILSCAGTGGLEAAIVNVLSPGDRVLGRLDRLVRRPVREDRHDLRRRRRRSSTSSGARPPTRPRSGRPSPRSRRRATRPSCSPTTRPRPG